MKKRIYNQPATEITELQVMSIICVSITGGGPAPDGIIGD